MRPKHFTNRKITKKITRWLAVFTALVVLAASLGLAQFNVLAETGRDIQYGYGEFFEGDDGSYEELTETGLLNESNDDINAVNAAEEENALNGGLEGEGLEAERLDGEEDDLLRPELESTEGEEIELLGA